MSILAPSSSMMLFYWGELTLEQWISLPTPELPTFLPPGSPHTSLTHPPTSLTPSCASHPPTLRNLFGFASGKSSLVSLGRSERLCVLSSSRKLARCVRKSSRELEEAAENSFSSEFPYISPINLTKPCQPNQLDHPNQPNQTQPAQPNPTNPTQPKPAQPSPTSPTNPNPINQPTQSTQPCPTQPTHPTKPNQPTQPTQTQQACVSRRHGDEHSTIYGPARAPVDNPRGPVPDLDRVRSGDHQSASPVSGEGRVQTIAKPCHTPSVGGTCPPGPSGGGVPHNALSPHTVPRLSIG